MNGIPPLDLLADSIHMNIMRGRGWEGGSRIEGGAGCGDAERTGRGNGCGGRENEAQGESGVDHSQGKGASLRSSATHTSAYVHTPSSSSISGGSKRLHSKKETSAEREERVRPGGERSKREGARERRGGRNEYGWGSCNHRSGIEEGSCSSSESSSYPSWVFGFL
jgi:hypothetical protein